MKGLADLSTIFHMRAYWHAPTPIEIHFKDLLSRSNINENYLIHLHFLGRVQCFMWWVISRFTSLWTLNEQGTRDMMTHRARIYFWNTIPLSPLFLCSAAPIENYFSQFALILLAHPLTRSEPNNTSHIGQVHSEWQHLFLTLPMIAHTLTSSLDLTSRYMPSEWQHLFVTLALLAHMLTSSLDLPHDTRPTKDDTLLTLALVARM